MRDETRAPLGTARVRLRRVSVSTREQLARSGCQVDTPAISQLQLVAIIHRVSQTERFQLLIVSLSPPTIVAAGMSA